MKSDRLKFREDLFQFLDQVPDPARGLLFGGERWTCVSESFTVYDEGSGGIVGFITMSHRRNEVVGLYILPDHRGKGHGTELLKRAVESFISQGHTNIRIDALTDGAKRCVENLPPHLRSHIDLREWEDLGVIR